MSNFCIYQMKRQKNYKPIWYCKKLRQQIILEQCKNCSMAIHKSVVAIKKKRSKLKKQEKDRYSIVQKDISVCYFCGGQAQSIHELIGGINRKTSMKWGLCVGACLKCHRKLEDNENIKQKYQKIGQDIFVKKYGFDLFMKEFGRNYKAKGKI